MMENWGYSKATARRTTGRFAIGCFSACRYLARFAPTYRQRTAMHCAEALRERYRSAAFV